MANESAQSSVKFCESCGQPMSRSAANCPGCGRSLKMNKTLKIVLIVAAVGVVGFISFIMLGIIAAVALPNFIGAQHKAQAAVVKMNMRTLQLAVESDAVEHNGSYPTSIDGTLKSFYPAGDNKGKVSGKAPENPFTKEPEWPVMGSVRDVQAARKAEPEQIGEGVVEYSVIYDSQHHPTSYAVRGGGYKGMTLKDQSGGTLVLSNQ